MSFLDISPYVFGTQLTWYSVFVLMGALACYAISESLYRKHPESKKCPDLVFTTFLIAFPMGLVGARLWFVLSELDFYLNDPISILKVWEGGLAVQGGVLLGAAVGIWYASHQLKKHGMNMRISLLMDLVIPNILLSQVIGRWGNFFNREVYGACVSKETLWFLPEFIRENMRGGWVSDIYVSCPSTLYAQPLFLYEGLLNLLGFILISIILRKFFKRRVDGTLTALYLVWYGAVRISLENLRNEIFIMKWGNISQSIVTSAAYIALGLLYIAILYIRDAKNRKQMADAVMDISEGLDQIASDDNKEETVEKKAPVKKTTAKSKTTQAKKTTTTGKTSKTTSKKATTSKSTGAAKKSVSTKKTPKKDA